MSDRNAPAELNENAVGDALRGLELRAPDVSAWPDLERSLRAHGLVRETTALQPRRWAMVAMAAGLVLAVILTAWHFSPGVVNPTAPTQITGTVPAMTDASNDLVRLREQSRRIESWLRSVATTGSPLGGRDLMAAAEIEDMIGLIDVQLAGSNDAGDETIALWRDRIELLRDLALIRTTDSFTEYSLAGSSVGANGTATTPDIWIN